MIKFLEMKTQELEVCNQYRFCFEVKNNKTGKIGIYEFPIVVFKDDITRREQYIIKEMLRYILERYEFTNIEIAFQLFNSWARSMGYDL